MNKNKRIIALIIVLLISITLIGCGKKTKNKKYINEKIEELCMPTYIEYAFPLPEELDGIQIKWETNEPLVMDNKGNIFAYEEDKNVQLTGTFTYEGTTVVQKFDITVNASHYLPKLNAAWNTYNEYIPIDSIPSSIIISFISFKDSSLADTTRLAPCCHQNK